MGSGKSTFLNFIRETIEEENLPAQVIEFKPWLYSGREDLIAAYFNFLRQQALTLFANDPKIKRAFSAIYRVLNPAIEQAIAAVAPGVVGNVYKNMSSEAAKALMKKPTLEKSYEDIKEALRKRWKCTPEGERKPLIVVIDDLDRLMNDEIKHMLQLVKTVGRLPYVTYILAYDREYINAAVKETLPACHASYLDKIIQHPIALPQAEDSRLIAIFADKFEQYINEHTTKWAEIGEPALTTLIKKPRDMVLLINAIDFVNPEIIEIVDFSDLVAMECIRLKEPALWKWLFNNSELLTLAAIENHTEEYYKECVDFKEKDFIAQQDAKAIDLLGKVFYRGIKTDTGYRPTPYWSCLEQGNIRLSHIFHAYYSNNKGPMRLHKNDYNKLGHEILPKERLQEIYYNVLANRYSDNIDTFLRILQNPLFTSSSAYIVITIFLDNLNNLVHIIMEEGEEFPLQQLFDLHLNTLIYNFLHSITKYREEQRNFYATGQLLFIKNILKNYLLTDNITALHFHILARFIYTMEFQFPAPRTSETTQETNGRQEIDKMITDYVKPRIQDYYQEKLHSCKDIISLHFVMMHTCSEAEAKQLQNWAFANSARYLANVARFILHHVHKTMSDMGKVSDFILDEYTVRYYEKYDFRSMHKELKSLLHRPSNDADYRVGETDEHERSNFERFVKLLEEIT